MPARDFTPQKYLDLITALRRSGADCMLLHHVDARPHCALRLAQIEAEASVVATYYFRSKHITTHAATISAIAALGHHIGYHYEELATTHGNAEAAYALFCQNLARLRRLAPVNTACAHGSPWSQYDNKTLWNEHDIHACGIDFDPMLDTDFSHTLYLTDSGRRWDGHACVIRDKVPQQQAHWQQQGLQFHTTDDIIHAISNIQHPLRQQRIIINTHPQRWLSAPLPWVRELCSQRVKNIAKRILLCIRY